MPVPMPTNMLQKHDVNNLLWPGDTIWQHRYESALAHQAIGGTKPLPEPIFIT